MMAASCVALILLAIFVGSLAWNIRELLESSVAYQKEILAELTNARLREFGIKNVGDNNATIGGR